MSVVSAFGACQPQVQPQNLPKETGSLAVCACLYPFLAFDKGSACSPPSLISPRRSRLVISCNMHQKRVRWTLLDNRQLDQKPVSW